MVSKSSGKRKTKIHLVFNEENRRDYLKGFKKRKDERRQKAKEEIAKKIKDEKKQIKEQQRETYKKMLEQQSVIPEIEHLFKPVTYDLPSHVVTVTSVTDVDLGGQSGVKLGENKMDADEEEKNSNPLPDLSSKQLEELQRGKNLHRVLNKSKTKERKKIQSSEAKKLGKKHKTIKKKERKLPPHKKKQMKFKKKKRK